MISAENKLLRIVIFDDNKIIRESVAMLLATTDNMQLAASFASCRNLVQQIELATPDVVLMDIDMPNIDGIEAVKKLRSKFPKLPVLMLTGFEDEDKVFKSICAGANGYVLKNASMDQLIQFINEAANGGAPMTPVIARKVLTQFAKVQPVNDSADDYNLSIREKEVLELLVKGKAYKMIAAELGIGYETVHSHMRRIYNKLQVNSVGEAVSKTITQKILR